VLVSPRSLLVALVSGSALIGLALLGGLGAQAGGAGVGKAVMRVTFWGALAMAVTAGIGHLFGTVV
jgi:VIT1/CCC1 family predicted Fe2+/Mn2+ transporter